MRKGLQALALLLSVWLTSSAQVTQINSNKSLNISFPLGTNKAVLVSEIDKTLWVTDATSAGTFQLSTIVQYQDEGAILNDKFIFPGKTTATGIELWITDGTIAGTHIVKDILPGVENSQPYDFALLNGYVYFSAVSAGIGRELWRTDGTENGTTLVKDIFPGPGGSGIAGKYNTFSTGSYLLLSAATTAEGYELWISDGTADGTRLLKDINPGVAASEPDYFVNYNNMVLFAAKTATNGTEIWKTDGTADGTQLVKDIRPGVVSSLNFFFTYQFNNKAFFIANNGTQGEEIWVTDGTNANTKLLKDIQPGSEGSFASLFSAVKVGGKFIFTAWNQDYDVELWESDGTSEGTKLFKEIAEGLESGAPYIFPSFSFTGGTISQPLFQGNKFFFMMMLPQSGLELWICDGTPAGTKKIKVINPKEKDGPSNISYAYTTSGLFFAANDSIHGDELWKSDGTENGTSIVADINSGLPDADIYLSMFTVNNKLLLQATNGDHATATDLYRIDGDVALLPVKLSEFTVTSKGSDALLNWSTSQEINSKDFTVQRSFDGSSFTSIGSVNATGFSSTKKTYDYADVNVMNSGKDIVYYRLLMNDKDGKSTISKVISVKLRGATERSIKLNNNPVISTINITLTGISKSVQLSIKDMTGKTISNVGSVTSNGQITIPADKLMPGVYVLVAENSSDRKVLRFVKQ